MCSRCLKHLLLAALALALSACEREERRFMVPPSAAQPVQSITLSELHPGNATPAAPIKNPYEGNAFAVSEGKRLFDWFNCSGCHAEGGGGMGPALMDDKWIYGSEPANIFATIVEGRPNGMPSFRGHVTAQQTWELTAYVRSMSGQLHKDVSPSRSDHMAMKPAEQSTPREHPHDSSPQPPPQ